MPFHRNNSNAVKVYLKRKGINGPFHDPVEGAFYGIEFFDFNTVPVVLTLQSMERRSAFSIY